MKFKNKKEMFKFIGFMAGAVALFIGSIIGISYFANKSNKVDNTPVVQVEEENGIRLRQNKSAMNTDTLSITAEITPEDCIDKTVSWELSWVSSSSEVISNYVSITPSADTLTCTVKVKKAFSTQINLTCKSNLDSSVSAVCKLDYVSRKYTYNSMYNGMCGIGKSSDMTGDEYAGTIKYALSLGTLSGGTVEGVLDKDQIVLNTVKLNNIDVSEYVIGAKKNQSINDMIQFLINKGVSLSTFEAIYFNVNFTYKVYYNYAAYTGSPSLTDLRLIGSDSTSVSLTVKIDVSNFSVSSVALDDSKLLF